MSKALILALCVALVAAHGDHGHHDHDHDHEHGDANSHVVVLTNSNFDTEIAKNEITLVEFYAPWCGHCKRLAPEYEKAAHELEGKGGALAKIDCTSEQTVCSKYDVKGYPTIKLFRKDGSNSEYQSGRTADAIVKFMEKQTSPAFTELADKAAIDAFASKDVTAIGFFSKASGSEYEAFIAAAKAGRNDYNFGVVTKNAIDVAKEFGQQALPAILVIKPFDEDNAAYSGEYTQAGITNFVGAEAFPLVGEIGPENYQKYLERKVPLVWLFVEVGTDATKDILAAAGEVAKTAKGKISFVWLDGIRWADHAKNFGVKGKPPGIVIEDRDSNKNYVYPKEQEITKDTLGTWVSSFLNKELAPTVKSQEIPADNTGPVKVVVGKSFDDIVMDDSKDVFVEFYAPWCGHCKSLAPKFEKLGEMFTNDPSIVIAKIDATENDTPAQIRGFPTLMLYPAGAKGSPETYSGDRTEQAMSDWIRAHARTLGGKPATPGHDEL